MMKMNSKGLLPPGIVTTGQNGTTKAALELLKKGAPNTILSRTFSADELMGVFNTVDCIFTDADGVVVEEGLNTFPAIYAEYIQQLADLGIATTVITGKPYAEVSLLANDLPKGLPLKIIYEKGAYYLEADANGAFHKHYLLSTPELEASVLELRNLLLEQKAAIEDKYRTGQGAPLVTLGWSGAGNHESTLSIDILAGVPPANYLQIIGVPREELKIKDPSLLAQIEADLQAFVDTNRPGWKLVHIGNGNMEIAPGSIEKDLAIMQTGEFKEATNVLIWGDSYNDRKMFELRRLPNVHAGLVLHREPSLPLVDEVDFVSFGMANAQPFFELLLATHKTTL